MHVGYEYDLEDPGEVDAILAKEMLHLDINERTVIHEELHGVNCLLPDETPEMVSKKLEELQHEIDHKIPPDQKQAYLRSRKLPSSHVETKSFRMRFLRSAEFNIPRVARRMVKFLDVAVDLFGEYALERPVQVSDFSKKELQLLRMGRFQFMPFGDRVGRRILVMFLDEVWESFPNKTKAKISLYMSWTAGNDIGNQRRGIVIVVWFDQAFEISRRPSNQYRDRDLFSVRCSGIHLCSPESPYSRLRVAFSKMRMGRVRRYLRSHIGNSIENLYALQSYGIPIDQFPISYNGKVKLGYIRQWTSVRYAIESSLDSADPKDFRLNEKLIEYPQPTDVVFRPGSKCTSHPANSGFRNLIRSKINEQNAAKGTKGKINIRRIPIVMHVIKEIQIKNRGRFLIWNDIGGWNELKDEEMISSRIDYLIKELGKLARNDRKKSIHSGTSIFRSTFESTKSKTREISPINTPITPLATGSSLPLTPLEAGSFTTCQDLYDLHQKVDEFEMAEAASCIAKCFDMELCDPLKQKAVHPINQPQHL